MSRRYDQYCPVAVALDVLGERWTLLVLRELTGGPRRYADLKAALPGIATNLLSDRLRDLADNGLVAQRELPPPAARTVYELTDEAWQSIPPILHSLGRFGIGRLDPARTDDVPPLTAFLAGVLLGFDARAADGTTATLAVEVGDRSFLVGVRGGRLAPPGPHPDVTVTATARDLLRLRNGRTARDRERAAERLTFQGEPDTVAALRSAFALGEPAAAGAAAAR